MQYFRILGGIAIACLLLFTTIISVTFASDIAILALVTTSIIVNHFAYTNNRSRFKSSLTFSIIFLLIGMYFNHAQSSLIESANNPQWQEFKESLMRSAKNFSSQTAISFLISIVYFLISFIYTVITKKTPEPSIKNTNIQSKPSEHNQPNPKKFFLRFDEIAILAFIGMMYLFFIFVK